LNERIPGAGEVRWIVSATDEAAAEEDLLRLVLRPPCGW